MAAPGRPHQRVNLRVGVATLSGLLLLVGAMFALRGGAAWVRGASNAEGVRVVTLFGIVLALLALPALLWSRRTMAAARDADSRDLVQAHGGDLPVGVVPSGAGVRLVTRPYVRPMTLGFGVILTLLAALFWAAGAPWGIVLLSCVMALSMVVMWWLNVRQEVDVDDVGVRRLHRPREQVAWVDLDWVGRGPSEHPRWWQVGRADDIALHAAGKVRTPEGATSDRLVLRTPYLMASSQDALQVLKDFHERAVAAGRQDG